jgi:F-type H+-transporting ATPase subunit h
MKKIYPAQTNHIPTADLVQDMYLKELKAYKTPAVKASDAEGHVQKFTLPKAPPSPEEADIASELKAYESQVPEVEGQSGEAGAAPVEQDWFEEPVEEEEGHAAH